MIPTRGSPTSPLPLATLCRMLRAIDALLMIKPNLTLLPLIFGLTASSTALAYRTAADLPNIASSTPVRWPSGLYTYVLYNQAPPGILFSDYEQAVEQALLTWTQPQCTSYSVRYFGPIGTSAQSGDGVNTVEFVENGWAARGYDPTAPGQTDVLYQQDSSGQWVITEADIHLNGENNTWALVGEANATAWSVRATLIHESGHAAGMERPCEITAVGNVPACSSSTAFDGVAMNPVYNPTLSALSSDDVAGICAVYPKGLCGSVICDDTETCTPVGCRLTCGTSTCDQGQTCESARCVYSNDASVVLGAPLGYPCSDSSLCERGLSCVSGNCQGGTSKLGDPCTADSSCQDGVCAQQGYCAVACEQSGDCNVANATCQQVDAGIGACITGQGSLGSTCKTADDCLGGECLADGNATPLCTRLCDASTSPCPAGWSCVTADNKNVCATILPEGCACRTVRSNRHARGISILSLLTVIGFALRRGCRRPRSID